MTKRAGMTNEMKSGGAKHYTPQQLKSDDPAMPEATQFKVASASGPLNNFQAKCLICNPGHPGHATKKAAPGGAAYL